MDKIIKSREYYLKSERKQTYHRVLNTVLSLLVVFMGWTTIPPLYDEMSGLKEQKRINSEIAQIVVDEGYKPKPYRDSRGLWTVGFGHLIKDGENFKHGLSSADAVEMLREDYTDAKESVEIDYPWAKGEVKLVLINMTYQMGRTGVSNFNITLTHLKERDFDAAAAEMLNSKWAWQTPHRASRLAGRIMAIEE